MPALDSTSSMGPVRRALQSRPSELIDRALQGWFWHTIAPSLSVRSSYQNEEKAPVLPKDGCLCELTPKKQTQTLLHRYTHLRLLTHIHTFFSRTNDSQRGAIVHIYMLPRSNRMYTAAPAYSRAPRANATLLFSLSPLGRAQGPCPYHVCPILYPLAIRQAPGF